MLKIYIIVGWLRPLNPWRTLELPTAIDPRHTAEVYGIYSIGLVRYLHDYRQKPSQLERVGRPVYMYNCVQHIDKYSVVESIAERLCQAEIKCIIIM